MEGYILLVPWVIVTGFIGWSVLYILAGRKGLAGIPLAEQIGLSYLFAIGAVTVQMFIMSLFGIGYTKFSILVPWAAAGTGVLIHKVVRAGTGLSSGGLSVRERPVPAEFVLMSLIVLQVLYNFFRALIKPIEAYDAVAIYGLKSKIIYLTGGISASFFNNLASLFHGAHPDYPLLIPLGEVWVYTFLGRFDDLLVKVIFPLFYAAFILVFYSVLKGITGKRPLALLFTFLLASVKQFSDYTTIAVADLTIGIYFAVGIFYMYLWFCRKDGRFLVISAVSSMLCVWTKNEGTLLALIILFVYLVYTVSNLKKTAKTEILYFLGYAALVSLAVLSWTAFKNYKGLVNENFNPSMMSFAGLTAGFLKITAILYEYQKQIFGFKKWNIIWILAFTVLCAGFRTAFSKNIKYVTWSIILFAAGYTLVYMFSAVEIKLFLSYTWSRFLLHILPVAVFWMAIVVDTRISESR